MDKQLTIYDALEAVEDSKTPKQQAIQRYLDRADCWLINIYSVVRSPNIKLVK